MARKRGQPRSLFGVQFGTLSVGGKPQRSRATQSRSRRSRRRTKPKPPPRQSPVTSSRQSSAPVRLPRPAVKSSVSPAVASLRYLYEELTPTQFEQAVADLLGSRGYSNVRRVGGAGDRGVDITCVDPAGRGVVVQCKQYHPDKNIGSRDMQNFLGVTTRLYRADRGLFVTTAGYTSEALTIAYETGIEIIDGPTLGHMYRPLLTCVDQPINMAGIGRGTSLLIGGAVCLALLVGLVNSTTDDEDAPPQAAVVTGTWTPRSGVTRVPITRMPSVAAVDASGLGAGTSARVIVSGDLLADGSGTGKVVARLVRGDVVEVTGPLVLDRTGVAWWPVTVRRVIKPGYVLASSVAPVATPVAATPLSRVVAASPTPQPE